MRVLHKRKKNHWLAQTLLSCLGALVVGYFLYHSIQGERGLFAMMRMEGEIAKAESTLAKLETERKDLEHRTKLLRNNSMDPDLLDERSRALLNYSKPNEIIILTPNDVDKVPLKNNIRP
ncbi:MAG: septum formation initiator family protein [Alphaproteobacteria bacterium]|nr:septum formation initiator family protein [Alphaproteobacteria bacterium]